MSARRLVVGDRVFVTDPGLEAIRKILARPDAPAPNNHHGTVNTVYRDSILIDFDDGGCAPYPPNLVSVLEESNG